MSEVEIAVSVVVPMFNAERYISTTLSSILVERSIPLEVVVVNDRSTDRSVSVVKTFTDPRIRLIEGPGRGAAAAMNLGFAAARGSILMICDADDCYPNGRVRQQVGWLHAHPDYDGVCGEFSSIDLNGRFLAKFKSSGGEEEITRELLEGHLRTSFCTYAIRSTLARRVGQFRQFFTAAYDLDYQLRIGETGRIYFLPGEVYRYRIHSASITHTQSNATREFFEATAYRLHLQRRSGKLDDLQLGRNIEKPEEDRSRARSASLHAHELLLGQAWREHAAGRKWRAVHMGFRAVVTHPLRPSAWKSVLALAVKPSKA